MEILRAEFDQRGIQESNDSYARQITRIEKLVK